MITNSTAVHPIAGDASQAAPPATTSAARRRRLVAHRGRQSTGSASLCTIVTGPAVGRLKFHTREWIFGPNGGRANATIGRAIRLVLWNIGRAHPGKLIKGTMGHPASWSYCIGEEQELSPWEPMHVDFGVGAADSAVTVMKAGEHSQIAVPLNTVGLNECITLLARGIGRVGITTSGGKRGFFS